MYIYNAGYNVGRQDIFFNQIIGKDSKRFARSVAQLFRKYFDVKIFPIYKTTKTKSLF